MGGSIRPRPAIPFRFRWLREDQPGATWATQFERTWPAYEKWFLKEGESRRPTLGDCRTRLERHMPELVPIWERLIELAGGSEDAARMLSLYRPTPYITGCSQAVWLRDEPMLVRNYDYHPSAFEGTFLHSTWSGTRTLVSSDCLWGVVDGINEHGLVVSLAFGGRREVGDGFGIPLILRYVLETGRSVADAIAILERVPSHMSYNVSLLDASGDRAVAAVAPDRSTSILREDVATNHQRAFEWSRYDQFTRSAEREEYLEGLLADDDLTAEEFTRRFLRAPLYNTRYDRAFGTLYTAAYLPREGSVRYLWPGGQVDQSIETFQVRELVVRLGERS
jgi:predicted choloylglycine hydrolase